MSDTDLIREALGAYASALRSGESESERMRVLHAQALAALARVEEEMAAKDAALQWLATEWAKYAESEGTERLGPYPDPSPELVRGIIEQALAAVSDGEAWVGEDTARRIIADMVCGSPSPGDEELFCALRLGHEGSHAGMTLDGLACEWRRSPKHRAETASTHCRFCGAHPDYWHLPCSDGKTVCNDAHAVSDKTGVTRIFLQEPREYRLGGVDENESDQP